MAYFYIALAALPSVVTAGILIWHYDLLGHQNRD
jgi:hypothetical protein